MHQERGFTLVETIVAVAIASMVTLGSITFISTMLRYTEASEGRNTVHAMEHALQRFYDAHCKDASFPTVSIATLISEGYLPSGYTGELAWGSTLSPTINAAATPPQLRFTTSVKSGEDAEYVRGTLGAHSVTGSTVTWQFIPDRANNYTKTSMDRFRSYFGTNC